jgi:hypothetical protein
MNDLPFNLPEKTVYVRAIDAADLPDELRAQTNAPTLYAIHSAEGQQLAIVTDRKLAFRVARDHEFKPVNVH